MLKRLPVFLLPLLIGLPHLSYSAEHASEYSPEYSTSSSEFSSRFVGSLSGLFTTANPSVTGGEIAVSLLGQPDRDHALWVGPRLGTLFVLGPTQNRLDFQWGGESIVWILNAIGVGFEGSLVYPSQVYGGTTSADSSNSVHFRFSPSLSVRFKQFLQEGAVAVKLAVPYDTLYAWGFQCGFVLQFSGAPRVGQNL